MNAFRIGERTEGNRLAKGLDEGENNVNPNVQSAFNRLRLDA